MIDLLLNNENKMYKNYRKNVKLLELINILLIKLICHMQMKIKLRNTYLKQIRIIKAVINDNK